MLINKNSSWLVLSISLAPSHSESTITLHHSFLLQLFEDWSRNRSWVWNSPYGRVWRRILDWFFIFLVKHLYSSHHTKVTVIMMILFSTPNHWNSKIKQFSSPISPLTQAFFTVFADKMGNLLFILITKLTTKIGTIRVFIKLV